MLGKLAFRNVKRSIKDYIIYLITITISFSLIFALNLVSWSDAVVNISENMDSFKNIVIFVNFIVIFVICFLINYTTRFMFEKRSKEFGTYLLLGIKKKKILKMFLLENIIIGLLALVLSIPLGFIFSQFISLFIVKVLELPQAIFINFNSMSFLLLLAYFLVIYILVLFFAYRRIKKISIYNLLYLEKQNEQKIIKTKKHRNIIFIISVLIGLSAYLLLNFKINSEILQDSSVLTYLIIGISLFIISIYGIMFSLSDFFLGIILKVKKIKYVKDNLFIARTFSSKVKTMGITLGTLGVMIMFTFLFLSFSSLNKGLYNSIIETSSPFDISVFFENKDTVLKTYNIVKEDYTIIDSVIYDIYLDSNSNIEKLLPSYSYKKDPKDFIMKISDYNKLLTMKGKNKISLNSDEYLLVVETAGLPLVQDNSIKTITLSNGITLNQKNITTELYFYGLSNASYVVVVPDNAVNNLDVYQTFMSIDTKEDTTKKYEDELNNKLKSDLCKIDENGRENCHNYRTTIKGAVIETSNLMIAIVTAICVYMSFIFVAIVGTILAIQSLSDSAKYKYRYKVLSRLGIKNEDIHKTIKKQLLILFGIPVIYPFIISFIIINLLNRIYAPLLPSSTSYLLYFGTSFLIFLIIYTIYFIATYFGFKRNIDKS